jgi:hypothetical protein
VHQKNAWKKSLDDIAMMGMLYGQNLASGMSRLLQSKKENHRREGLNMRKLQGVYWRSPPGNHFGIN